jgi:hypothetical protein
MVSLSSMISLIIFCLDDLLVTEHIKVSTTTLLGSICPFKSFSGCLMKLGALTLGAYRLIAVISF